jgi:hydrogenase maturation protein HypF
VSEQSATIRRRFDLRGQVQGVGFRPYVYRLAARHALAGYVANNSNGAVIEIEGPPTALDAFERDLVTELPPLARIAALVRVELAPQGDMSFRIRMSEADPAQRPEVTPDAATCGDCLRELLDPADRRYRYPFTNCTNCGPRYSIIRDVPYDRPQTTMAVFEMCPACSREYHDPADRRFHAQPNACPVCGPQLRLLRSGSAGATAVSAMSEAARLLGDGAIVAVKGIGGYHLACRADREDVVRRLRERKLRDGKPLAVMVPNLEAARRVCRLSPADEDALRSVAAPIVLARQAQGHGLAPSVAPGCRDFGIMLPYAPVHHLLFAEGLGPLVMTSANLAGQPLTYRDEDALTELGDVADAFLVHDREIFRPVDDSVVFTFRDEVVPMRRARGYAPRPIRMAFAGESAIRAPSASAGLPEQRTVSQEPVACAPGSDTCARVLAVGGELKSTVCLLNGSEAVLSEHLGDLTRPETFRHYMHAVERLEQLCGFRPDVVACDLHPRYLATEYARRLDLPVVPVQHHHAHIASVMAEWGETGPVVGLSCDGTGYGTDGAVWGCEVLVCERGDFERAGHLEYFPLVGGDRAAIETWRPAAALVRAAFGEKWPETWGAIRLLRPAGAPAATPNDDELRVFEQQIVRGVNAPATSSLGRVFDAVSFLLGLCDHNRHEAEAAMALEAAVGERTAPVAPLPYRVTTTGDAMQLSLLPTIRAIVEARLGGSLAQPDVALLAARFHETVARMLCDAARAVCLARGVTKVALSGGCFANRWLLGRLIELLESTGSRVLYNRHVPAGDGGIALGQAFVALW